MRLRSPYFEVMIDWILAHEPVLRLAVFAGVLGLMLALEAAFPRRDRVMARVSRWRTNGLIVVIDTVALRVLIPTVAAGVALWAQAQGFGLFNLTAWPVWLEIALAIMALDLSVYGQHVATHKIPVLWAFHQVHHIDRDLDATSGIRFHPVEIVLSLVYKFAVILVLGPAAVAVILFEILLNASSMFNHANLAMPLWLDRMLRPLIVTPDMHRVHHSVHNDETNSNFGFCLSSWDRLFRTYKAQPVEGHHAMTIGLPDHQTEGPGQLAYALALPFRSLFVRPKKRLQPET